MKPCDSQGPEERAYHPSIPALTMSRRLTLALLIVALFLGQSANTVLLEETAPLNETGARNVDVRISEILVSASSEDYNGTDWNNDGDIGSVSDQFIELWNAGTEPVDVSDWLLDDMAGGGSAPCRLAWNTTIEADGYIVIFRASSRIELDYWDGDTATISDSAGNVVDTLSYPGEDSWWDTSYLKSASGNVSKVSPPTPGWGDSETHAFAQNMVRCYGLNDNVHSGAYVLKGRIVPMTGEADVINDGHVLVKDGMIEAVWENDVPSDIQLTNVPVLETNGTIYPGLLDLHNHLHYNQAPLWDMTPHLSENNRNAWGGYNNRYEWKNHPDYSEQVTKPKMLVHSGPYWNMESEAMKYIEMKSLVGGATAAQGGPSNPDDSYATVLSRNIEDYNFGRDEIHTKVTELTSDYVGNHIKTGNASGELDAWFIHIAEGVDERSRAEFDILVQNNLLVGELVLIHGVALGAQEFRQMADVGATLVWSPLSNLLLYGQTADIAAAKEAGVHITLAPDWAPSGSKSPLHELKVADLWDDEMLGDIFTDYELVDMVTAGAAEATNWDNEVGTIAPGMVADLVVVDNIHANPYRNLINAIDPDVRLTIVGGLAVYGDTDIMTGLKGADNEPAGKFGKAVDVTFLAAPEGAQTWASIVENLTMAMRFDVEEMTAAFGDANDFDSVTRGMSHVGLDPWYTYGDERYFNVLNGSGTANVHIEMSLLYDRYYDRAENLPAITEFDVIEEPEPEPCADGSMPPCASTNPDNGGDNTGDQTTEPTNSTDDNSDTNSGNNGQTTVPVDTSLAEEEDVESAALMLFFGLVIVLLAALYFVSRGGEDALAAEVQIEKMWDEQEAAAKSAETFVPAPPPMAPPAEENE